MSMTEQPSSAAIAGGEFRVGHTPQDHRVLAIIAPALRAAGLEVVRVLLRDRPQVLQVMVERADGDNPVIEECAAASRIISALLDVADPIPGAYTLEVSSPGIDRPLTRLSDFERFAGFEVKVELKSGGADGRRRFRGPLLGIADSAVCLRVDGADVALPYADISRAKLVLTDELLTAPPGGAN